MSTNNDRMTLVLDVGKTNVKMLIITKSGSVLETAKLDNQSLDESPYPHPDTNRIFDWFLDQSADFARQYLIDAIVPTTHGCAAALIGDQELILPILDYEFEIPDETSREFTTIAPAFEETYSPDLPVGLNLARQLYWQQREFPHHFSQVRSILTYPQYWSWRLCGVAASEVTSLGCHGHLWNPRERSYASIVDRQGWRGHFPPIKPAYDALGTLLPELTIRTGLPVDCQVYNGIHDSNAAYSLYLKGHPEPFSLISTGTWVVMISPRLDLSKLNKHCDTMAIVDLNGDPLPIGRYMGGREFEILRQDAGVGGKECSEDDLRKVIAKQSFLLPSFAPGGPFMGRRGSAVGPGPQSTGELLARATLYMALMTMTSIRILEVDGDLMIDGGFVNNAWYCRLLATLSGCPRCFLNHQSEGTAVGAGMLAIWSSQDVAWPLQLTSVERFEDPGLEAYVERWKQLVRDS